MSTSLVDTLSFHPLSDLKLFGRAYSGLEYDYRGLIHIYEVIDDHDNYIKYNNKMEDWRALRTEVDNEQVRFTNRSLVNDLTPFFQQKPLYGDIKEDGPLEEVTQKFFEL